jgi:hypothetical protein
MNFTELLPSHYATVYYPRHTRGGFVYYVVDSTKNPKPFCRSSSVIS